MGDDSSEEEHFEDAVDASPAERPSALPSTSVASPEDPFPSFVPSLPTVQEQSWAPTFAEPTVGMSQELYAAQQARRQRLGDLRTRLREEFAPLQRASDGILLNDDALSVVSESTSLHSWHARMLSRPNGAPPPVCRPLDSMSTRAVVVTPSPIASPSGPLPSTSSRMLSPTSPIQHPPSLPPPLHPPPPLPTPRQSAVQSPEGTTPVRIPPPPLPPRNPNLRLPVPIREEPKETCENSSLSVVVPLEVSVEEEPCVIKESKSENVESAPASREERKASPISNVASSSSSANTTITPFATPQTTTTPDTAKKRGHTKTNSLDRGLTLAKSLKSGPWPPPSNKSNSLKRTETGAVENGAEATGEEEERNTEAEGVIHMLTTSLLEPGSDESAVLADITELSPHSTPSTESSGKKCIATLTNGDSPKTTPNSVPSSSSSKGKTPEKPVLKDANGKEPPMRPSPPTITTQSSVVTTVGDPMTRDIQRRISNAAEQISQSGSETDEPTSTIRDRARNSFIAGFGQARSFVRDYSNLASGIFRGVFHKQPRAIALPSTTGKSGVPGLTDESEDSEDDGGVSVSEAHPAPVGRPIVRPRNAKKGPFDFEQLRLVQELGNEHTGAVWCMRFSVCGRLLATAGNDCIVRVWVVKSHYKYFNDMKEQTSTTDASSSTVTAAELQKTMAEMETSFRPPSSTESTEPSEKSAPAAKSSKRRGSKDRASEEEEPALFHPKPFALYKGHTADVLDVSWSRNYFLLSAGMDRTVKLWHLSRQECLCCFQHVDFVTCVAFLPKDDRYFLSGSLDGMLRLWNIPDKKVAVWNEVDQVKFITALTFVKNGNFVVVGTYNGRCFFYTTEQLKYHTVIDVRSSRGKNARGHKVTGLAVHGDRLLVTSNDSRLRVYDLRDKALTCKLRGLQNERSQIRAAFSPDGKHIICGSEDTYVYLWRTQDTLSVRKDRNANWERIRGHTAAVTVAIFAPKPQIYLPLLDKPSRPGEERSSSSSTATGHVIVSADLEGNIRVMANRVAQAGQSTFFANPE